MKTYIFSLIFSSSIHELQNIWIKSTLCTITWCNLRIIAKKIKRDDNDKFPVFYWGLYTNNTKRSSFETLKLNANIKSIVNNKSMNENCIQNIFWMNKQKYLLHRFLRSNVLLMKLLSHYSIILNRKYVLPTDLKELFCRRLEACDPTPLTDSSRWWWRW